MPFKIYKTDWTTAIYRAVQSPIEDPNEWLTFNLCLLYLLIFVNRLFESCGDDHLKRMLSVTVGVAR